MTPDRAHMPPGIAAEPGAACRRATVRTRWSRHCQFGRPTGCAVTTGPSGVRRRRTGPGADFSFLIQINGAERACPYRVGAALARFLF
ncbi:hypothetical protein [Burkholderia vietnamiensis]|uniref:hypothetical protein n=1 Tax=Burkholderia vietnamiensis TaxID=60552 RepID=UPI0012DAAD1F|nr:hypothetical protein [Burkholderia vietnamiensis]MBH9644081.1 hypothetical protein [Burkholderia vietnamiensis]MBR7911370.1 hypothetical protein [Burkholderia vietnamiensis]MCA8447019.1 hypothetical protein [Burkholderia vietnamiensis]HDR8951848.1 hypothetical protein [Burkholderia vietnamiensis]HDR9275499.1 hypothetical protein [Burkholderia vietnamiensis]